MYFRLARSQQLPAGAVLAGKYRLLEEIGRGKCATVWLAEMLHGEPLHYKLLSLEEAKVLANRIRKPSASEKSYNIYQVVMGYEHYLQMQALCGAYPEERAKTGRFQHLFYKPEGGLRFEPTIAPVALADRLKSTGSFDSSEAEEA